ncbi:hypothetical protein NCS52_01269600 [Fusarium sp. LHS14.1]|nr:hypothetical protein NCS52_01269600 [Fusarium sp. LHS14.1]
MSMGHRRGPWSNAEDAYLMDLVNTHGPLNWVRIAQTLGSRTPKQCRERYHQNLKPSLNHEPITPQEGAQIDQLVREIGKRWAEIARRLNGRSDNAVKNWWNGSQNRRKRMDRRRNPQPYDEQYAHSRHSLSISTPGLSMPSQLSPLAATNHRHPVPWVEAPLPSPCTSESAESDAGSNYTTSPGRHHIPLHMPLELPPIRDAHHLHAPAGSKLPSLSEFTTPSYRDQMDCQPRQHQFVPQGQLPTAPNSPVQQQAQTRQQPSDQDSRMKLTSLLLN